MTEDDDWEQRSATGKPMVPATPRDVVHILVGAFMLIFLFAFAFLGIVAGAWVMTGIAVILGVVVGVDIALAVRRQKERGTGEAG
ncbi:hypothetical protein ABT294_24550 [Nonomuraea sp. NPDC000554]|uniref:hypothetical protein n=1 Tax=Nonomuraea sp. NPDC000554 TaxID=3154259 RepID=UPI00332F979B